jgi:hypothetical protein
MTQAQKLTRRMTLPIVTAVVVAVFAVWASVALAATPGAVTISSTTHPVQSTWYQSANPAFTWTAATESGGTIAGYSFVLDQNLNTVPLASTGTAALSYLPKVNYTVGSTPAEDRVADLNGDGKPDLVIENSASNTVSVLIGNGDGTLKAAVNYATGTDPWSLAIGDVNGDGKPDLVICDETASTISVLLGNGDGTFQAHVDYTTGAGTSPESMRLGDFNGDGKLDVVTANAGTSNLSILLNQGNGTFGAPSTFGTDSHPTSVAVGDLNGDGKQDVVTANIDTSSVSVLMGNGNGTFQTDVNYACGSTPETVVLADLNGDGHPDIATANYVSTASVLINSGTGTFAPHVDYATGSGPYSLEAADMNHDGAIDLVTVNHAANSVSVLYGNGDGTMQPKIDLSVGNGPFWVALGDFNHDGYGDIAVTNYSDGTVSVLLGSAYFSTKTAAKFSGQAEGVWYMHVRAVDTLGAGGPTATYTVRVDATAPATTASGLVAGAGSNWTNAPLVTLAATDALSGVAATYYTVDGGARQTYTTPFSVSTAGSHAITYWSVDNAGNVETAHNGFVNIDVVKPVTVATGLADTTTSAWHTAATSFTLAANDTGGSGLATTNYTIDGGASAQYTGAPVPVSGDASHVITYWSTDAAGNAEDTHTGYVNIDSKAPATTAATDPSGWTNGTVQVTLHATDSTSGLDTTYYQVGAGALQTYSAPFTVSDATQVSYWSTDVAGNVESHHTFTPQIDTQKPTASDDIAAGWQKSAQTVNVTTADTGGSGVAQLVCTVDGTDQDLPAAGGSFQVTSDGKHTISYYAVDAAGNKGETTTKTLAIDSKAPITTAATDPSVWTKGTVQVTLSADDTTAGLATSGLDAIWYQIGNGPATAYSGPITAADATQITYWSTDKAGNEEAHNTITPQIDSTAPVTTSADLAVGPDDDWQPSTASSPATVTLDATDDQSGVDTTTYQIDSQAPQTYTGPISITDEGSHKVTFYSTDAVGNREAPQSGYVNVDSVAPTSSATGLQVDGTTGWQNDAQSVTLTASDAGSGMTGGQAGIFYSLDGSTYSAYTGPFTVKTEGSNQVSYYAVDAAGNPETAHSGFVNIDTTPPVTTAAGLVDVSDGGYIHDSQQVTLTAADSCSGTTGGEAATWYTDSVDGAAATAVAYTGPFTVSGVGSHTITYYSVDALGNAETAQVGYVNILPDQALVTLASGLAADGHSGWLATRSANVSLRTSGGGGTITTEYRVEGGQWLAYTSPFSVTGDGSHRVDYRSSDSVGDPWSQSTGYVNIDTVGPVTVVAGPTTPQRATTTVRFSASDAQSGVAATYYNIDGGSSKTGTTAVVPALANHKADGGHTISYYSVDNAGNTGPTQQFKVTIDTTRPVLALRGATSVTVRKGRYLALRYRSRDAGGACKLVLTFSHKVHTKVVKTTFTISAKRVSSWQSSKLRLKLAKGAYTVKLQLRDLAGNLSAAKTMRVTVK